MPLSNMISKAGQVSFPPHLTNKISAAEYAKFKAHFWLFMLNKKVLVEFERFLKRVNEKYKLNIKLGQ